MQTQLHTVMIEDVCRCGSDQTHTHVKRHRTGVPLKEVDVTACYLHSHNLITHLVTHIILHTSHYCGFPSISDQHMHRVRNNNNQDPSKGGNMP